MKRERRLWEDGILDSRMDEKHFLKLTKKGNNTGVCFGFMLPYWHGRLYI